MPGVVSRESSAALYYKLNLAGSDVSNPSQLRSESNVEETAKSLKSVSPARRSWFDDVTANSLERRRKKSSPQVSKYNGSFYTLPRGLKFSSLGNSSGSESKVNSSSSSTHSNFINKPTNSEVSACDDINQALNNFLPESGRYRVTWHSTSSEASFSTVSSTPFCQEDTNMNENEEKSSQIPKDKLCATVYEKSSYSPRSREKHDEKDLKITNQLVETIRELKDIADVARVIDEVDDEEWLLLFIEELEVHLNDLIKLDSARTNDDLYASGEGNCPQEEENTSNVTTILRQEEMNQKETLLSVALELVRYLKERSTYALHRQSSRLRHQKPEDVDDKMEGGTLRRLKILSQEKPKDFTSMTKWQRKLSCLAGTLDKYLQRLESKTTTVVAFQRSNSADDKRGETSLAVFRTSHENITDKDSVNETDNHLMLMPVENRNATPINARRLREVKHLTSFDGQKSSKNIEICRFGEQSKERLPLTAQFNHEQDESPNIHDRRDGKQNYCKEKPPVPFPRSTPSRIDFKRRIESSINVRRGRLPNPVTSLKVSNENSDLDVGNSSRFESRLDLLPASNRRHNRGGSLDRQTWRKERASRKILNSSTSSDDSKLIETAPNPPKFRNHIIHKRCHNRSMSAPDEKHVNVHSRSAANIHTGENTVEKTCNIINFSESGTSPKSNQSLISSQLVIEKDKNDQTKCHLLEQRRARLSTYDSGASGLSSQDSYPTKVNISYPMFSSSSSQCDILSEERTTKVEQQLVKLKSSSELLRRGITEAREERDEKDRKIAILESRVQRMKKSMEQGRTEKGSIEVEVERLTRMANQERRDTEQEIKEMQNEISDLEDQRRRQELHANELVEQIKQLKQDNQFTQQRCIELETEKREMEEKIHDATLSLMREKRQNRRLQAENVQLEEKLSTANDEIIKAKKVESLRNENNKHFKTTSCQTECSDCDENVAANDHDQLNQLKAENTSLSAEYQSLRSQLQSEASVNDAATDCFRQQIEYLSNEISIQQQSARTQKEQYELEIDRLLSTRSPNHHTSSLENRNDVEMTSLRSQIIYQQTLTNTLYAENERLRQERDNLLIELQNKQPSSSASPLTQDFSCQVDDMSYTRMRAFDFYAQEAQRDALRLIERGRQLQEESLRKSMEAQRLETELRRKTAKFKRPESA